MELKLSKVYSVSKKAERPRIWLQHLVCEAAGLIPGEKLFIHVDEINEEITLQNHSFEDEESLYTVHVASRKNRISGKERPLVDTAGDKYSFLDIKQKIEINVFKKGRKSKIVIRPLQYSLLENSTMPTPKDKRIRLLSIGAGCGIGTSAMVDTNYFSAIQEIEIEDDSVEVLLKNFPNSHIFAGDLRDVQNVAEVDVALVTLPCNEFSSLGFQQGNIMDDLVIATSKIIKSSRASVLFFENVPAFYKSQAWHSLKQLLLDDYPYWSEKNLEAWDFGSLATRNRTYCCAFSDERRFAEFEFPKPQKMRRKKLKDFLDSSKVQHEWKSIDKWMESFNSREAWKDRKLDLTFVTDDAERIQCIPKRYTGHSSSSSYLLSLDKKSWRFLTISEIRRILGVPEWFELSEHTQKIRRYEMLGQSVDCRVIKAISNRIAYTFMKIKDTVSNLPKKTAACSMNNSGQLELIL